MRITWAYLTIIGLLGALGCQKDKPSSARTEQTNAAKKKASPKSTEEAKKADKKAADDDDKLDPEDAKVLLVGIWRLDPSGLKDDPEIKNLPPADRIEAIKVARKMAASMAFEFADGGKMAMYTGQGVKQGSYTIEKADKNVLYLQTTNGGKVEQVKVTVAEKQLLIRNTSTGRTQKLVRGGPTPTGGKE